MLSGRPRGVFHQFEKTKTSEPSNSAASSSAAHTTEIVSHRLSLSWTMNPLPSRQSVILRERASVPPETQKSVRCAN
jgi:hypothetical protein